MNTNYHITEIIKSFLNEEVFVVSPQNQHVEESISVEKVIHTLFLECLASKEITETCSKISVSIKGSYLANQAITALHPVVNDKDVEFRFIVKEGYDKSIVYQNIHDIATRYFKNQDSYIFFNNMLLASIILANNKGGLPLELSMLFADHTSLTHLTNVDSLYVPIQEFEGKLGSEKPEEFILCSREGGNVEITLSQLKERTITSSKMDWNPEWLSHRELARYFTWIIERWTEPGTSIFSPFFEGSIRKNSPEELWKNLCKTIIKKRPSFPSYPFFLLTNFLFHIPLSLASNWILQKPNIFTSQLRKTPFATDLQNILYTEGKELRSDALLLLSCHIPLLAEKIEVVNHLEKRQLQCCFSENRNSFAILIPIPATESELLPWIREIFLAAESETKLLQIICLALSDNSQERQQSYFYKIFEQILPHLEKNPYLWPNYKKFLGEAQDIQKWMFTLYQANNEQFFRLLSLESDSHFLGALILQPFFYQKSDCEALKQILCFISNQHINSSHSWKVFCIRFLMESQSPPMKYLKILFYKSGIVCNERLESDLTQFPKLLGKEERRWIFTLKLALLFEDSSFVAESLQTPIAEDYIQELKNFFSKATIFNPLFLDLIHKGKVNEATRFLKVQKRAWGIKEVLTWYLSFFHLTKFPAVKELCADAAREALQMGENPWRVYVIFGEITSIARTIEPLLPKLKPPPSDFLVKDLSIEEKNVCLQNILAFIALSIQKSDLESAHRLASYLPFLDTKEEQVASLLIALFEKSLSTQERHETAFLMHQLTPVLTKMLIERFQSPYSSSLKKSFIHSDFPLNQWIFSLLFVVQNPSLFSLLIERFEIFFSIYPEETDALVEQYVEQMSEEQKEKIGLSLSRIFLKAPVISQKIFNTLSPILWKQPWTSTSARNIWNLVKNELQPIEEKNRFITHFIEIAPKLMEEGELLEEMIPFMNGASQSLLREKSTIEMRKILKEIASGQIRSLLLMTQEPFYSIFGVPLYQQLIEAARKHFGKNSQNEIEKLPRLIVKFPKNASEKIREDARWLIHLWIEKFKSRSLDSQLLLNCFIAMSPSLEASSDTSIELASFQKHLAFMNKIPQAKLKKIYPDLIVNFESCWRGYLLELRNRLIDPSLSKCAFELVDFYMNANREDLARAWIGEWSPTPGYFLEGAKENEIKIREFHDFYWMFLHFMTQKYPTLIGEFEMTETEKLIEAIGWEESHPLLEKCKRESLGLYSQWIGDKLFLNKSFFELLSNKFDPSQDSELHLQALLTNCLEILYENSSPENLALESREEFFDKLLAYYRDIKNRMPLSEILYASITKLALLSLKYEIKGNFENYLEALIPPLDWNFDDLQQISLMNRYYMPIQELLINKDTFSDRAEIYLNLAEYIARMSGRFIEASEISTFSRRLFSFCRKEERTILTDSLILNVHIFRLNLFCKKNKRINIREDLAVYLEYQLFNGYMLLFDRVEFLSMLNEYHLRKDELGMPDLKEVIADFIENTRTIVPEIEANCSAFYTSVALITFLLDKEDNISEQVFQLASFAYDCQWGSFGFAQYLDFFVSLEKKISQNKRTSSLFEKHKINRERIFDKIIPNYQISPLRDAPADLSAYIYYINHFLYTSYKANHTHNLKNHYKSALVDSIQKLIKERKEWFISCFKFLPINFPESLKDFQKFLEETDLNSDEKEEGRALFLSLFK